MLIERETKGETENEKLEKPKFKASGERKRGDPNLGTVNKCTKSHKSKSERGMELFIRSRAERGD